MSKKVIIVLITLILLVSIGLSLVFVFAMPRELTVSKLISQGKLYNPYLTPKRIAIFNTTTESGWPLKLYVKDEQKVKQFLNYIKDKPAVRISDADYEKLQPIERKALHMEFDLSDKLTEIEVFADGRMAFSIPTSEYRNKSRLYWLRWKLDGFGTCYTGITYVTRPDPIVAETARDLFEVAKPRL